MLHILKVVWLGPRSVPPFYCTSLVFLPTSKPASVWEESTFLYVKMSSTARDDFICTCLQYWEGSCRRFSWCVTLSGVLCKPESHCYKPFQKTNLEERSEELQRGGLGLCSVVEITPSCFSNIWTSDQNVKVPFVFVSGGEIICIVEALTNVSQLSSSCFF